MPYLFSIHNQLAVYKNAVSSSYWTMPSIASLFTGQYSSSHGLVVDGDKLDSSLYTLPEFLERNGYNCAGFVNNLYVSEYSGLNRGFHNFYSDSNLDIAKKCLKKILNKQMKQMLPPGITNTKNNEINIESSPFFNGVARVIDNCIDRGSKHYLSKLKKWIKKNINTPFFVYFHIFETHSPYRAPGKYAFKFLRLKDHLTKISINHNHLQFLLNPNSLGEKEIEILKSAYDNSILYADQVIQRIFKMLKKTGVYDNSIIVLISDHGDNIGDHGMMFHYFCLYDSLIHVPLFIKFPKNLLQPGEYHQVVQNVDIFPTICSLLDSKEESLWKQFEGNDLLKKRPPARDPQIAISELIKIFGPDRDQYKKKLGKFNRRLLSIRTKEGKFIFSSKSDHEYYNIKQDPFEMKNLYGKTDEYYELERIAVKNYKKMDAFYQANKDRIDGIDGNEHLEEDIKNRLKSLGYM
jgi:arylsulfatase A-like enzyme